MEHDGSLEMSLIGAKRMLREVVQGDLDGSSTTIRNGASCSWFRREDREYTWLVTELLSSTLMGWYVYAADDHVRTSNMRATISCAILGCSLESSWARLSRNFLDAKMTDIPPRAHPVPVLG
jgi:hypothetical protein